MIDGSIPACTGEPPPSARARRSPKVYPRVYGGTDGQPGVWAGDHGLSPRVRGNPTGIRRRYKGIRSIPACTGEPDPLNRTAIGSGVYPRVYGGTDAVTLHSLRAQGLSPRVRGNHDRPHPAAGQVRSIPACTGEPPSLITVHDLLEVYPRVYGGTKPGRLRPGRVWGLSPRVRGNPARQIIERPYHRSIPACTGEPAFWLPLFL